MEISVNIELTKANPRKNCSKIEKFHLNILEIIPPVKKTIKKIYKMENNCAIILKLLINNMLYQYSAT